MGIEEIIARSEVAKATLYRHFPSKVDLVLAFLARREECWTMEVVRAEAWRRGKTAEERLLAIFDVFDEWFRSDGFDACSFINTLVEMGAQHPLGKASLGYLANIRAIVRELAEQIPLRDPIGFAHSWHILMKGSVIAAVEGDVDAAQRGRAMGITLIDRHRLADDAPT